MMIKKAIDEFSKNNTDFEIELRFVDNTDFKINSSDCEIEADDNFIIFKTDGLNTVVNLANVTSFDLFIEK